MGDFLFQQKCEKRMQELMAGGTTVVLVSHSIEQIESTSSAMRISGLVMVAMAKPMRATMPEE